MRVTPEMIASLREKYAQIKRLRHEHDAGVEHDAKRDLAALARRFPGALRELDQLPMEVIDARLAEIDAALGAQQTPQWVVLQVAYHGAYRAALRIKRRAGRTRDLEALLAAREDLRAQAHGDEPMLADLDERALLEIVRPAGGRLHAWVLRHVAQVFGVTPESVAAALYLRERVLAKPPPNRGPQS